GGDAPGPRYTRHGAAPRQRLPADGRVRDRQVDALRRCARQRGGALLGPRVRPRRGDVAVGRQGNGGAGVHGREDPGVLLPGDDARIPRRALMAGGGAGSATPLQWADFEKVDMRVGVVTDAREFPEARRPAYRLWIDFGTLGVKRSSTQITTHYRPTDLIGRLVIAVVNFPPKQI